MPAHRKEYSALSPAHTQLCPHAGDCNLKQSVQTRLSALPWGTDVQLLCRGPSLELPPDFWMKKFCFNILFLELCKPTDHERARPRGNEEGTLQRPLEYFECRPVCNGGTTVIPNFTYINKRSRDTLDIATSQVEEPPLPFLEIQTGYVNLMRFELGISSSSLTAVYPALKGALQIIPGYLGVKQPCHVQSRFNPLYSPFRRSLWTWASRLHNVYVP